MMIVCSVDGCDAPGAKRTRGDKVSQYSMCGGHRTRYYKHGDVMADVPVKKIARWHAGWLGPTGYPMVGMAGHPVAQPNGHARIHRVVLYDAIGPGAHPCHWCGKSVSWEVDQRAGGLEVDHLDGDKLNYDLSNLVPACTSCNSKRRHAGNPTDWKVSA